MRCSIKKPSQNVATRVWYAGQQEAEMRRGKTKPGAKVKPLPTIWRVPDAVWERVATLTAEYDPPKATGRPRSDERTALDGVIYHGRTGCQWNQLPREFGDDSSVHRALTRWVKCGLFERLWAVLLGECDELNDVDWKWQSADGTQGKARHGGDDVGPNPTDRGEKTARNAACWSRPTAARWPWSWPGRTCTTARCSSGRPGR